MTGKVSAEPPVLDSTDSTSSCFFYDNSPKQEAVNQVETDLFPQEIMVAWTKVWQYRKPVLALVAIKFFEPNICNQGEHVGGIFDQVAN